MPNPIIYFEIAADDVLRAKTFYEKTFGWTITYMPRMDYYLMETKQEEEPGINGGLLKRTAPGQRVMNYIHTESVEASLKKIKENGGVAVLEKHRIPGFGAFALFRDSEGNVLGLHEVEKTE